MRVLVLYASDLDSKSRIAPGGITSNVRGYLSGLPREWDIEVWGAAEHGSGASDVRTVQLGDRVVRLRPLVLAGPAASRRIPLAVRYCAALAAKAWQGELSRRHWDVMIAHRAEYLAVLATACPFADLPPSIVMIHGSSAWSIQGLGATWGRAYLISERTAVRHADAVALVSGSSLPFYRARYSRWAERFHWIPNGVDTNRFAGPAPTDWRVSHGFTAEDRILVYHGRYDYEKGLTRILEALRVLLGHQEPWHLVSAGVGPLSAALAEAAQGWGRGHVHDMGYLGPTEIVELLRASDLALLCSDFEGMSNGLLEALAAGLPVVATDVGDNHLILEHLTPELITAASPVAIADTVRWAWNNRFDLARRAPVVASRYSLDARVDRIRGLVEQVASKR